jgi:hypothetical protein
MGTGRKYLSMFILLLVAAGAFGQGANTRAQGKYYAAKESFQNGDFESAARFCGEAKELLGGKTNDILEYVNVMALYRKGDFQSCQKEIETFFAVIDESALPQEQRKLTQKFSYIVETLTDDEIKEVSKILEPVARGVTRQIEARKAEQERIKGLPSRLVAAADRLAAALVQLQSDDGWTLYSPGGFPTSNYSTFMIEQTPWYQLLKDFDPDSGRLDLVFRDARSKSTIVTFDLLKEQLSYAVTPQKVGFESPDVAWLVRVNHGTKGINLVVFRKAQPDLGSLGKISDEVRILAADYKRTHP